MLVCHTKKKLSVFAKQHDFVIKVMIKCVKIKIRQKQI